jgi:hypothetical protein
MNQYLDFDDRMTAKLRVALEDVLQVPQRLEAPQHHARSAYVACMANQTDPLVTYAALTISDGLMSEMSAATLKISQIDVLDAYGVTPEVAILSLKLCGCIKLKSAREMWVTDFDSIARRWCPEKADMHDFFLDND